MLCWLWKYSLLGRLLEFDRILVCAREKCSVDCFGIKLCLHIVSGNLPNQHEEYCGLIYKLMWLKCTSIVAAWCWLPPCSGSCLPENVVLVSLMFVSSAHGSIISSIDSLLQAYYEVCFIGEMDFQFSSLCGTSMFVHPQFCHFAAKSWMCVVKLMFY